MKTGNGLVKLEGTMGGNVMRFAITKPNGGKPEYLRAEVRNPIGLHTQETWLLI